MASSMKERNGRKAWEAYEKAGEKLKAEAVRKREAVEEKYRDAPHPPGLDTDPAEKELGEVTKWFGQEVKRLREKYGIR